MNIKEVLEEIPLRLNAENETPMFHLPASVTAPIAINSYLITRV